MAGRWRAFLVDRLLSEANRVSRREFRVSRRLSPAAPGTRQRPGSETGIRPSECRDDGLRPPVNRLRRTWRWPDAVTQDADTLSATPDPTVVSSGGGQANASVPCVIVSGDVASRLIRAVAEHMRRDGRQVADGDRRVVLINRVATAPCTHRCHRKQGISACRARILSATSPMGCRSLPALQSGWPRRPRASR